MDQATRDWMGDVVIGRLLGFSPCHGGCPGFVMVIDVGDASDVWMRLPAALAVTASSTSNRWLSSSASSLFREPAPPPGYGPCVVQKCVTEDRAVRHRTPRSAIREFGERTGASLIPSKGNQGLLLNGSMVHMSEHPVSEYYSR